ncbi:MAG: tyrosine-type recombinase/integrase [Pseudomonadales bacterium]|nr:tyrosine-type recombinase/integrase [Pseudomonadales bacterium]
MRRGRSPQTARSYRKNLLQFCSENNIRHLSGISREVINDWLSALRDRNLTDGTIANHLWALKAFLTWLEKEQQVDCYRFDIHIPKVKDPEFVEYLEPDELDIIFSLIDHETLHGMRLRTYTEVMLNTGLRPSETLNLRKEEIAGSEITIIGKGNKDRKVYFNKRARHWINAYCSMRKDTCPALFVTNPKYAAYEPRPISLDRMEEHFRNVFRRTGIRKKVTLHTLRHTYATTLVNNGCPVDFVAPLLGHRKVETTRKYYVAIQQKNARNAHFRFLSYDGDSPRNDKSHTPGGAVHTNAEEGNRDHYNEDATYIQ